MMTMPVSDEFKKFAVKANKPVGLNQSYAVVISADQRNEVTYIRDGVKCNISDTIRQELWITDGTIIDDSTNQVIFITIDFKKTLMRFKKSH